MADVTKLTPKLSVLESRQVESTRFEVLQYEALAGTDDLRVSQALYFAQHTGTRLKQVKITLDSSGATVESGTLQFMRGPIEMQSQIGGVTGFFKKVASKVLSSETAFKPLYQGTGEIYLEPSFGHFLLVDLCDESLVVEKGMFLAASTGIGVGVGVQKTLSSTLFGGEGFFQTRLDGTGVVALLSPVPAEEVIRVPLHNDVLRVDGNFAILRKGDIQFTVEKSSRSILGTLTGGEGLLQTFRGTGEVWLAPTQGVYRELKLKLMEASHLPPAEPAPAARPEPPPAAPDKPPEDGAPGAP